MRKKPLAVLAALAAEPNQELHLGEICDRAQLLPGTTWLILFRFESHGLVCARWDDAELAENHPRHGYYKITVRGVSVARTAVGTDGHSTAARRWLSRRLVGWCPGLVRPAAGPVGP